MGLIAGYNPPAGSVKSSSVAFMRAKPGVTITAFYDAAVRHYNQASSWTPAASFRIPPNFSKRSGFRVTFEGKTDTAGKIFYYGILYTNTGLPGVGNGVTAYGAASAAPALSTRPAIGWESTYSNIGNYTPGTTYTEKVINITLMPGYEFFALIVGCEAGADRYVQKIRLSYDPDTDEVKPSASPLWAGVL